MKTQYALLILILLRAHYSLAFAASDAQDKKLEVVADLMSYDKEQSLITASGHATIFYNGQIIEAEEISYSPKKQTIVAKNGVSIKGKNGDVYNARSLFFDLRSSQAQISHPKAILKKNITISADQVVFNGSNQQTMSGATFTPCTLCASNFFPTFPLWQIKAQEAAIDNQKQHLTFHEVSLQFLNKTIFYTPYFTLPSPNAQAKSGFLVPILSFSNDLGTRIKIPYYFRIANNIDATFAPTFSTKIGTLYNLELRHLLNHGQYQLQTSGIYNENQSISSYIKADGEFHGTKLNNNLNYGFKFNRLFDKNLTYLKKYQITNEEILLNQVYLEHKNISAKKSHWLSLELLSFQDLRILSDLQLIDSQKNSAITNLLRYQYFNHINKIDTAIHFSSKAYNTQQSQEIADTTLEANLTLNKKILTNYGNIFEIKFGTNSQISQSKLATQNRSNNQHNRFMPYVQTIWSLPLLYKSTNSHLVIEPIAGALLSPDYFFQSNESVFEMRKINFFDANRFLDWLSSDLSPRFDYGAKLHFSNSRLKMLNVFLGHSTYLGANLTNKHPHNYLIHTALQLNDNTYIIHKLWMNQYSQNVEQHELDSIIKFSKMHLNLRYSYVNSDFLEIDSMLMDKSAPHKSGHEASANVSLNFYKDWWIGLEGQWKLNQNEQTQSKSGKLLKNSIGLLYKDECLQINFAIKQNHTEMKDLKPSTIYVIQISVPTFNTL